MHRIVVLGDFSGRASRGLREPLAGRRPRSVDRDNFDDVLGRLGACLRLSQINLAFGQLDDFHPDRIYESCGAFDRLAQLRRQPARRAAAVVPQGNVLEAMLEQAEPALRPTDELADFVERVVTPHLETAPDTREADALAGDLMRAILHHPAFQSLEAAWRALNFLVSRLDDDIPISLFDATKEEVLDDLEAFQEALGKGPGSIAGNYVFGQTPEDAAQLARLGAVARAAGMPLLAEALPPEEEAGPHWHALRREQDARWIGLALPRFLLRAPYGRDTSTIDSFDFEEMPRHDHAQYLWGNPAFCCALLRAQGGTRRIGGLPMHVYKEDGESVAKPCAEVLMSETEAAWLLERGFMPLASLKHEDAALLVRFQSIAEPAAALP